ncbi:MAG: hypothetical protein AB1571_01065 [Nanoarchaeota archaeon]
MLENKVNGSFLRYAKFGAWFAVYLFATYVENNGKMLLVEHGLIDGNAWQITKDFFILNWTSLPTGIIEGLIQIGAGYSVVLPTDLYLGTNAFRWIKKKSIEYLGKEHYLNMPLNKLAGGMKSGGYRAIKKRA